MKEPVNLSICQPVSSTALKKGFTLLEVLVTVIVLSIGIVGVLSSYQALLSGLSSARDVIRADWMISDRLSFIESSLAQSSSVDASQYSGSFSGPGGFEGNVTVEGIKATPNGSNSLSEVNVTVWRKGSRSQYSVTTTMLQSKRER